METWGFKIYLSGVPDDLVEWSNKLYEAGCDDSSPGVSNEQAHVDFDRQASTLSLAVQSAVRQIKSCGYDIDRVELAIQEVELWTDTIHSSTVDSEDSRLNSRNHGRSKRDQAEHFLC